MANLFYNSKGRQSECFWYVKGQFWSWVESRVAVFSYFHVCYVMFRWGVAVLELDSQPDITTLNNRQPTLWLTNKLSVKLHPPPSPYEKKF